MYSGVGARLKQAHTCELASLFYDDELQAFSGSELYFSLGDAAHALVLHNAGIINAENIALISKYFLLELGNLSNSQSSSYTGMQGDFFVNRQSKLSQFDCLGDLARVINAGRPRRESTNLSLLMQLRDEILNLSNSVIKLIKTLCSFSRNSREIFMTDFTYMIGTQPTTLAHYISSCISPLVRQLKRLQSAYAELNLSPAGAGSTNGTMMSLDRDYHARLLCFDDILIHTKDATWAYDIYLFASQALTNTCLVVKNICDTLLMLMNDGYSLLRCSDKHSRISIIMPHKKNPYQLSMVRGFMRDMASSQNVYFNASTGAHGYPDARHPFYVKLGSSFSKSATAVEMLSDVIDGLKVEPTCFLGLLKSPSIYTADISQFIATKYDLPERSIHELISRLLSQAESQEYSNGDTMEVFCTELCSELSLMFDISISIDSILSICTPNSILQMRHESGSAGTSKTMETINSYERLAIKGSDWVDEKSSKLDYAMLKSELLALAAFKDNDL